MLHHKKSCNWHNTLGMGFFFGAGVASVRRGREVGGRRCLDARHRHLDKYTHLRVLYTVGKH